MTGITAATAGRLRNRVAPASARQSVPNERSAPTGQFACSRRLTTLLLGILLLIVAGGAQAVCTYTSQPGTVTFAPPATITVPNDADIGTVLWTSSTPVTPASPVTVLCLGATRSGIQNNVGSQPAGGDDTLFPTGVPGLSYHLLYPDVSNALHTYPNQPTGSRFRGVTFDGATALQLVVTGRIAPGSVISGGPLAQWNIDMCKLEWRPFSCESAGTHPVIKFSTSGVTFVAPACTVIVDPTVVTLPSVLSSNFSGIGFTAGQKDFDVQLDCPAGSHLFITLSTAAPAAGPAAAGVIAPTTGSGFAGDVGVQILDRYGTPVDFGTPADAGITTDGRFNVPFYARYYQTGPSVSGGRVKATATYTLTYQ